MYSNSLTFLLAPNFPTKTIAHLVSIQRLFFEHPSYNRTDILGFSEPFRQLDSKVRQQAFKDLLDDLKRDQQAGQILIWERIGWVTGSTREHTKWIHPFQSFHVPLYERDVEEPSETVHELELERILASNAAQNHSKQPKAYQYKFRH